MRPDLEGREARARLPHGPRERPGPRRDGAAEEHLIPLLDHTRVDGERRARIDDEDARAPGSGGALERPAHGVLAIGSARLR